MIVYLLYELGRLLLVALGILHDARYLLLLHLGLKRKFTAINGSVGAVHDHGPSGKRQVLWRALSKSGLLLENEMHW